MTTEREKIVSKALSLQGSVWTCTSTLYLMSIRISEICILPHQRFIAFQQMRRSSDLGNVQSLLLLHNQKPILLVEVLETIHLIIVSLSYMFFLTLSSIVLSYLCRWISAIFTCTHVLGTHGLPAESACRMPHQPSTVTFTPVARRLIEELSLSVFATNVSVATGARTPTSRVRAKCSTNWTNPTVQCLIFL